MLAFLLFAAALLPSQQASTQCVNTGANVVATEVVQGPSGASAVLKVSTSDDNSKDSHLCNADYQLLVTPAAAGAPVVVDLLTADDDYGRNLTLRLDGFTRDGKKILGILSESGKRTAAFLFKYDSANGSVQLVDLKKQFLGIMPPSCSSTLGVIGTRASGAIVLEQNSSNPCGAARRWSIVPTGGKPQALSRGTPILSLYDPKDADR